MTDRLRTLLHEAAKDARNYSQAELGPAAAQLDQARRRSMILPLAVAASVVLITVAALVAVPLLTESDESGPAPASSTSYPRDIEPPPNASPLPSGTVGAAAFIYAPCYATCDPFLVMPPGSSTSCPGHPGARRRPAMRSLRTAGGLRIAAHRVAGSAIWNTATGVTSPTRAGARVRSGPGLRTAAGCCSYAMSTVRSSTFRRSTSTPANATASSIRPCPRW